MQQAIPYFSIFILGVVFMVQFFSFWNAEGKFSSGYMKWIRGTVFFGVFGILFYYFFLVLAQYTAWKQAGPPLSFLVPPYRSIGYVFSYHFIRFLLYYVISCTVAVFFFLFMKAYDKRMGGRFFEPGEVLIASLVIFLLGYGSWHYLWMFYLFAIALIGIGISFFKKEIRTGKNRFSFYFLWIPFAIAGILIMEFLV